MPLTRKTNHADLSHPTMVLSVGVPLYVVVCFARAFPDARPVRLCKRLLHDHRSEPGTIPRLPLPLHGIEPALDEAIGCSDVNFCLTATT